MPSRDFPLSQSQELRVLLIDSDPVHLDLWSALLCYVGYTVYCARNCFDAALLLSLGIHCILLDYRLPDMNGIDFARHFSAPGCPAFVLLTDESSPAIHLRALEAGACAAIAKPASLHEVVDAIEQACWKVPHVGPRDQQQNRLSA